MAKTKKLPPVHPGEMLRDAMHAAGLSGNALALALRIPANRITGILGAQRSITADTALRLGRFFGTSAEMWMRMQSLYDLQTAEDQLASRIEREVIPLRQTA